MRYSNVVFCLRSGLTTHLGCDGSEYKLAGAIWLLAQEEVEEGEFVDVDVELHVAVGGHGSEGLLGDGCNLLLAQRAHVQEGSVKQSTIET